MQYHLKISSSGKVFNNTGKTFHQNKHGEHKPDQEEVVKKNISAEDRLHPLYFKKYINHCAKQLATDGCYSDETIDTFSSYNCSLDDANYTSADDDKFINAKNRGGLWKVSPGVFEIFRIVEKHFRANVTNQKRKIDVQRCQH